MLRSILDAIRAIPSFISRVREEPVMLMALALILLQGYQEAAALGLGGEDLILYVAELGIGWFARELVVPTVKLEGATPDDLQPVLVADDE